VLLPFIDEMRTRVFFAIKVGSWRGTRPCDTSAVWVLLRC